MENATQELETEEVTATPGSTARLIREVKTRTRKRFSAEEKIRIVLEGFRKENISTALYYSWLKDFMEAGKARLKGDTVRNATKSEVGGLKPENSRLKELFAEQAIRLTKQAGIDSLCFFRVGFKGETAEEIQETIRFARRLDPTYVSFHVVSAHEAIEPHPYGSQRILALPLEDSSFDSTLKRQVRRALRQFYLRPRFIFHRLRQLILGDRRMFFRQLRLFLGYFTP